MNNKILSEARMAKEGAWSSGREANWKPAFSAAPLCSLLAALAMLLIGVVPGYAAGATASRMSVSVQPEFDDPRVLIVHQADLDPSVQLPVDVTFNVPKDADVGMACEINAAGGHACKPFRSEDKGDYQALTFTVSTERTVFLEYYYTAFPAGRPERSFDFILRPGFPVKSLSMEVQQPLRSSGFALSPKFPRTSTDEGFTYHVNELTNISVGKPLRVKVTYSKTDSAPSVTKAKDPAGNNPAAAGAATGIKKNTVLLLLALALGAAILIPFFSYMINRSKSSPSGAAGSQAQRQVANRGDSQRQGAVSEAVKFCTSCGAKLRSENRFCSQCGAVQA